MAVILHAGRCGRTAPAAIVLSVQPQLRATRKGAVRVTAVWSDVRSAALKVVTPRLEARWTERGGHPLVARAWCIRHHEEVRAAPLDDKVLAFALKAEPGQTSSLFSFFISLLRFVLGTNPWIWDLRSVIDSMLTLGSLIAACAQAETAGKGRELQLKEYECVGLYLLITRISRHLCSGYSLATKA